jgi:YesN/AraC family two-component response regulator
MITVDMGKTLIVDDEQDIRLLLRLTINREDRGLRVVGEASSGEEALIIRRELDIDVIVLDQRMPGLTGVETAKALRPRTPTFPSCSTPPSSTTP